MAAVLACGDGAALSHMSAAALWGLLRPEDGPVDVSLPSQSGRRRRKGIRIHRCTSLAADEEAHLSTRGEQVRLAPLVTLRHRIPVTSVARTVDDLRRGRYPERLVRLPAPEVNVEIGRHEVDFLWRSHALVVETDFYDTHRGEVSFEDDHRRDMHLRRLGYTVHRYTGAQIRDYPAEVVADLGEILERDPVPRRSRRPAS